jgi:hypothetical protein
MGGLFMCKTRLIRPQFAEKNDKIITYLGTQLLLSQVVSCFFFPDAREEKRLVVVETD